MNEDLHPCYDIASDWEIVPFYTPGKQISRHKDCKSLYRIIDFKRQKFDVPATVLTLEYDPNRSAHIALIQYEDGEKAYIIAPNDLKVGDIIPVHMNYGGLDIKANAKVVSATTHRAGAQFVNLDTATANQLLYLNMILEDINKISFK